jgi:F5/8 type C domain/PLAT/LH2 domain
MKRKLLWTAAVTLAVFATALYAAAINGFLDFVQRSAPGNPASGNARVYVSSATNVLTCILSSGASCMPSGITYPGSGVPNSTGSGWGTSYGVQGTDSNVLTAGTMAASGILCVDGNGGATTSGCSTSVGTTTIWSGVSSPNGSATDLAPHNMTTNSAPTPYVASCSSAYSGTGCYQVFDGNTTNGNGNPGAWSTNGTSTGWLEIDMGSAYTLGSYAIHFDPLTPTNRAPAAWTFAGSNDNSSWTTLDTRSGQSFTSGQTSTYTISSPASFRYYKLNITANNGGSYLAISEMYLYSVNVAFNSGNPGDWYYETTTNQWFGPRPSGGSPTWPVAASGTVSNAPTFTASGCSNSTLVGGSTAGSYKSGTTGTCTVTVTMGLSAPNGWACKANDLTTTADAILETGTTQATAILSGTTASGDTINFFCIGY